MTYDPLSGDPSSTPAPCLHCGDPVDLPLAALCGRCRERELAAMDRTGYLLRTHPLAAHRYAERLAQEGDPRADACLGVLDEEDRR